MKVLTTFQITKGFERWLKLINEDLKPFLLKYKVKVHFACCNEDENKIYDLSESEDPTLLDDFMEDKEIHRLRTEAGVVIESQEVISVIKNYKIL